MTSGVLQDETRCILKPRRRRSRPRFVGSARLRRGGMLSAAAPAMPDPYTRPHVLVADDDAAMRTLLAEVFRSDGFDVSEAADGRELFWGIERAIRSGRAPDLVVSDVRMPGYSGIAVLEALLDFDRVHVVLMTSFPDPDMKRRAAKLGALLLEKPFDLAELLRVVHEILPDRSRGTRRSPAW